MKKKITRRKLIEIGIKAGVLLPVVACGLTSCREEDGAKKEKVSSLNKSLNILILGGTSFLGPHQIAYAISRGHKISTFTRGKTEPTVHKELFTQVDQLIGDRENDLAALEKGEWDVVIDNSGRKVEWTKKTAELLKDRAQVYMYTSSTGVYYPYIKEGISEETTVLTEEPKDLENEEDKVEYWYGVMKANSEIETIKAFGEERSIIVRPTYMIGPADLTDRFIYWPVRLAKGGDIMVPGKKDDHVQYVDVRDVAEWMIRLAENQSAGTFNAVGPPTSQTMLEFINDAKNAFEIESNVINIDSYEFLEENGIIYIIPWIMQNGNYTQTAKISNAKGIANGLTYRDLKDSIKDIHKWWYSDALTDDRRAQFEQKKGTIIADEKEILEKWKLFNQTSK